MRNLWQAISTPLGGTLVEGRRTRLPGENDPGSGIVFVFPGLPTVLTRDSAFAMLHSFAASLQSALYDGRHGTTAGTRGLGEHR